MILYIYRYYFVNHLNYQASPGFNENRNESGQTYFNKRLNMFIYRLNGKPRSFSSFSLKWYDWDFRTIKKKNLNI